MEEKKKIIIWRCSVWTWFRPPFARSACMCIYLLCKFRSFHSSLELNKCQTQMKDQSIRHFSLSIWRTAQSAVCRTQRKKRKKIAACGILAKCSPIFNIHQQIHRQLSVFRKSWIRAAQPSHAQLAFASCAHDVLWRCDSHVLPPRDTFSLADFFFTTN